MVDYGNFSLKEYLGEDGRVKDSFIKDNLKLVNSVARQFAGGGVDFEELVQEGCIGLLEAFKRFDETRGTRFDTYAFYWIRRYIVLAFRNNSSIYFSFNMDSKMLHYKRGFDELRFELGRVPTDVAGSRSR